MTDPAGYQRLFAELKCRRVFRVMAVYGVVAFVLLQVIDLLVPALLLPDWTYRLVAILLLVGFPLAGAAAVYQVFSYQMAEDYEGLLATLEGGMEGGPSGQGGRGAPAEFVEAARRAVEAGEMPRFLADMMSREFEDSPFPYRAATLTARSWAAVEPDSAFARLRFIAERPNEVESRVAWFEVLVDPAFDVLRDDPRYGELAARFGF